MVILAIVVFLVVSIAVSVAIGWLFRRHRHVWYRDCSYVLRSGRECEVVDVDHFLHIAEGQR